VSSYDRWTTAGEEALLSESQSQTLLWNFSPRSHQQFEYLEAQKQAFLAAGWPVISVDTKKKELIGNFKNNGKKLVQQAAE